MKQNEAPKLSIIVPVYNVEKYLDKCLTSIEMQTYPDFEVLMIDDGSTDSSGKICREREQRDSRFRYFYQPNQGLGPARNKGIELARAARIMFIDSDDWVDITIVEKLLPVSINTDADAVFCDFWAVFPDGEKRTVPIRSLFQLINASGEERMHYSVQRSLWSVVYKRDIWVDNHLLMPDIIYEDTAVYGMLLCYLKNVVTISEALYFYRAQREGSLMQIGRKDYRNMLKALDYFLKGAQTHNLFNRYSDDFFRYCVRQLGIEWKKSKKSLPENELTDVKKNITELLSNYFPKWTKKNISGFMALGSFVSCEVYYRMTLFCDPQKENYSFTSLESLMSDELSQTCCQFRNTNPYRTEMVIKDLKKTWKRQLSACKYIILDLLEERHDLIKYENSYITKSEAFDEVCILREKYQVIPRRSTECRNIWMESCDQFFHKMRNENIQVFILELYLCENKGLRGKEAVFENIEEIREINKELLFYYEYIKHSAPDVTVISMREEASFSGTDYPYGCFPWHYNEMGIFVLAEEIYEKLNTKEADI